MIISIFLFMVLIVYYIEGVLDGWRTKVLLKEAIMLINEELIKGKVLWND